MNERGQLVLAAVLRLLRPLARLLLRQGITYPVFAAALKPVFLEAAQQELAERGARQTDSALTLLSGVHRRDVRALLRAPAVPAQRVSEPTSLASEVVARWLADRSYRKRGRPAALARGSGPGSFDSLVASVSSDVRPRAVLDELVRLGVAEENEHGVTLLAEAFLPRQGFAEMAQLFADNVHDHAAAAAANLQGQANLLEQAVFVDQLTPASAHELHLEATRAWHAAFRSVMDKAQSRFDEDAAQAAPHERTTRARFGVYFYMEPAPQSEASPDTTRPTT